MSSCLSGGRAAYGFDLDIVVKPSSSPATSSRSTHSSPSSTLSESSNSPLAISTKRARAPRKRPNQTYNEAAALLSTVYPNVFSAKSLPKLCEKNTRPFDSFSESPAELLPPFPALGDAGFLIHQYVPDEPSPRVGLRPASSSERSSACLSPASVEFPEPNSPAGLDDDFDAESILDEEVGEGIDSIMGNLSVDTNNSGGGGVDSPHYANRANPYLGNVPMGHGFGRMFKLAYGHGGKLRRALRRADDGEWWRSPTVEVLKIAPKLKPVPALAPPPPPPADKKKKKVQKVEKILDKASKLEEKTEAAAPTPKAETATASTASTQQQPEAGKMKPVLSLKLDYQEVLKSWSGRGSPFSDAGDSSESRADTIARLSKIELFPEGAAGAGGLREASVLRYKEKRRTRLFSKKIRYQVRKVNADCRPRMKASGRFVRRPSSLSP